MKRVRALHGFDHDGERKSGEVFLVSTAHAEALVSKGLVGLLSDESGVLGGAGDVVIGSPEQPALISDASSVQVDQVAEQNDQASHSSVGTEAFQDVDALVVAEAGGASGEAGDVVIGSPEQPALISDASSVQVDQAVEQNEQSSQPSRGRRSRSARTTDIVPGEGE